MYVIFVYIYYFHGYILYHLLCSIFMYCYHVLSSCTIFIYCIHVLFMYYFHILFSCYIFHITFSFMYCTCSYTFRVLYFVVSIYCIHINFSNHFTFLYIFIYPVGSYNLMLQNLSSHSSAMLLRSYHIFSHVIFKSFVLSFMPT